MSTTVTWQCTGLFLTTNIQTHRNFSKITEVYSVCLIIIIIIIIFFFFAFYLTVTDSTYNIK